MARRQKNLGSGPSMQNVAAYAGVSTATVSKVLQGVSTIRAENVKRVQNAIEALGYRINPLAAELRRGQRRLVGVIVPTFEDSFFGPLITALEQDAEKRGYALAATSSRGSEIREADLVNRMHDWRVAGVIVAPAKSKNGAAALLLKDAGLPAVFLDQLIGGPFFDTVSANYRAAVKKMTRFTNGSTLILHQEEAAAGPDFHLARFKRAFVSQDRKGEVQFLNCLGSSEALQEKLKEIFDRTKVSVALVLWPPGALILANEIRRRCWNIPADLSVVGFEATSWMEVVHPAILSIKLPTESISAKAVELLFRRIEHPTERVVHLLEAFQFEAENKLASRP